MSHAWYARDDEPDGTYFQVVPADGPVFFPLVAIGLVILWLAFSGISFILVFLVVGTCIKLGLSDLRPVEHRTSARFRVTPEGIEALGQWVPKNTIEDLAIGVGGGSEESPVGSMGAKVVTFHQAKVDAVMHALKLRTTGQTMFLAGGMDSATASQLLSDVKGVLANTGVTTRAPDSNLVATRPALTVARVSVGLIGIEIRAFTGEVGEPSQGKTPLRGANGQMVIVPDEQFYVAARVGERLSLYWGVRRGENVHKIDKMQYAADKIGTGWGTVSEPIVESNHTTGAMATAEQAFNRMIIPNRALYNAMAVVVVFGGLFSLQGAFFGSPEGLIFLPFAVYFFIWVKRRQRVLKDVINAVDARFKEPQTFASAAVTRSLDGTITVNSGL
jgi:hypothetical protein